MNLPPRSISRLPGGTHSLAEGIPDLATLQTPDHLEEELEIAPQYSGRTKDPIAVELLAADFKDESLPMPGFTEAQLAFEEQPRVARSRRVRDIGTG